MKQFYLFTLISALHQTACALSRVQPSCRTLVDHYEREHGRHVTASNISSAFIFFLHVPRTAGKTYATCFLRAALPPRERCAPSYDFLRLNISQEGCRYLVSHDDYSLISQLPENTEVITQLRNPVSRVLSAYEFAVEVASRRIKVGEEKYEASAKNTSFVSTLNVWPWSHLVPWFRRDIRRRMASLNRAADAPNSRRPRLWQSYVDDASNRTYYFNAKLNHSLWELPQANATLDPYSNPLVMPLDEWIETPVAWELIHDGSTLQILGLTNYSHWRDARPLRECYFSDLAARKRLVGLAKARLRSMRHVGLTEELDTSVASLAAGLGHDLKAKSYRSVAKNMFSYDEEGFDWTREVEFNATVDAPAGKMVKMSVLEARRKLVNLEKELESLQRNLKTQEPKLAELVENEEKWLDEEAARKEGETGGDGGTDGGAADVSVEAEKNSDKSGEAVEEAAGVVTAAGGSQLAAAAVRGHLSDIAANLGGWLRSLTGGWPPVAEAAEAVLLSTDGGTKKKGGKSSGKQAAGGGQEEQQDVKIDSPWAEEIEKLDAKVFAMQQKRDRLQADIDALKAIPEVKGPATPQGRAKLIMPESDFDEATPLGTTYRKCSHGATSRASNKRRTAFKDLTTPWLESFAFTSEARKQVDAAVLERIKALNKADYELWELGKALLYTAVVEQRSEGTLQELPPDAGNGTVKAVPPAAPVAKTDVHSSIDAAPAPAARAPRAGNTPSAIPAVGSIDGGSVEAAAPSLERTDTDGPARHEEL